MDDFRLYKGVKLGDNSNIGMYALIGVPPRGTNDGDLVTTIGDDAVVRSHTVIYAGNNIGSRFQTGHSVVIREKNEIGNDVSIGSSSVIEHHIKIGNGVRIHSNAFIPEYSVLEDDCWIGPCVVITNARYPKSPNAKENLEGVHIGKNARIGAGAVLLPGVTIGEGALIGAGAVVTRNVAPREVVVGNPAKIINRVENIKDYGQV
jgi:acetyltransferase-like isoleucine patch superfamily enzyme